MEDTKNNIPEGWHTYTLGEIYTERKEAGDPELPILTVSIHSGVSDGALDEEEIGKTVKRIADKTQYKTARAGDLVFNMMRAWQGAIGVARSDGLVSPAYIVATPNEELVYPLFMDYYMKSPKMVGIINRQSYGVTDFRKRLYWDSFAPIKCTLPSLAEQKIIVAVLETQTKELVQETMLLCEKKKRLGYLVRELVTGKKRLQGYNNAWERISLSQIGAIMSGGTPDTNNPDFWNGDIPWCTPSDITQAGKYIHTTKRTISSCGLDNSSGVLLPAGSILMCSRASIGPRCINTVPMATNQGFKSLVCNTDKYSAEFIYYLLGICIPDFVRISSGSTFLELSKNDMEKYQITVPCLEEQVAISIILSKADQEIELLEKYIEQKKRQKKTLTKLLLSGSVRVK